MIDIHAHILPGIDDGAADIYETLEMAAMAAESGVRKIVATPHCNIPGYFDNYFDEMYLNAYRRAREAINRERIPVKLLPGAEVFATYDLAELIVKKKIMPLNQSRYILIEFSFDENPDFANAVIKNVQEIGVKPVIAHVERYEFIQDAPKIAAEWAAKGCVLQVNKGSYTGRFGKHAETTAMSLLKKGLVSVIASDAHGAEHRTPFMLDAYDHLKNCCSQKELDMLFRENPERICSDRPILRKRSAL